MRQEGRMKPHDKRSEGGVTAGRVERERKA